MGTPCGVCKTGHPLLAGMSPLDGKDLNSREHGDFYRQIYRQKNLLKFSAQGALSLTTCLSIRHLANQFLSETRESEQFPSYLNCLISMANEVRQ
jgi:hypothetical protein